MKRSFLKPKRIVQGGFSLVELMVALAIGLVITGALYSSYTASLVANRTGRAVAQISEDASAAISVLRGYVTAATYSQPYGVSGSVFARHYATDNWINGCNGANFLDTTLPIASLTCNGAQSDGPPDALAVQFEADASNSLTKLDAGEKKPLDCLGALMPSKTLALDLNSYWVSYSRFFITNNQLQCIGPGNAGGQTLVDNIQNMQILYGVAAPSAATAQQYLTAQQVATAGAWPRVVSIRVCLVVRSQEEVMDSVTKYQGCDPFKSADADLITPSDRRMYRAFTSTFMVQNRRGLAL